MAGGRREEVAGALATVVGDFGANLSGARVRALLNDVLGTEARPAQAEVNALSVAADAGVAAQLAGGAAAPEVRMRLEEGGMSAELAAWAVGAWAAAVTAGAGAATVTAPEGAAPTVLGEPAAVVPAGGFAPPVGQPVESGAPVVPVGVAVGPPPERRRRVLGSVVAAAIVVVVLAVVVVAIAVRQGDSGNTAGPGPATSDSPVTTAAPSTTTTMEMVTTTTMAMPTTTTMDMGTTTPSPTTTDPMATHGGTPDMGACADPGMSGLKATITESAVVLAGSVADEAQKAAVRAAVPLRHPLDQGVMVSASAPSAAGVATFTQVLPGLDENLVDGTATLAGDSVCVSGAFIDEVARTELMMIIDGLRAQGAKVDSHVAQHEMAGELHVHDLQLMLDRLAAKKQVPFAEASAELEPSAGPTLDYISDQVIKRFQNYPELVVEIKGYTDSVGSDESNLQLSMARADRVMDELIARGVAPTQVKATGFGESDPVATNETPEGREMNRRVVFGVLHGDGMQMG